MSLSPDGFRVLFWQANRFNSARVLCAWIACALAWVVVLPCSAQTPPQVQFPDGIDDLITPQDALPPAIYMLDDGTRVFIPITPYREFERRNQAVGSTPTGRAPFTFDSIEITGEARGGRAELDVLMRIDLDASLKDEIVIPLMMKNFHRLSPFEVDGISNVRSMTEAKTGSQTILGTPSKQRILVQGKFSVRVNQADVRRNIDFRLPVAPTTIKLTVDQERPFAVVTGSTSEEIVRAPEAVEQGKSLIQLEAAGGDFAMAWGASEEKVPETQSLEVEGDWKIDWQDPQQTPQIEVTYKVRNLTGNIQPFEMRIPSQFSISPISFSDVSITPMGSDTYRITPALSDTPRLTFQIQVDVPGADYRTESPLPLVGMSIAGSVRETGTIKIQTTRDHRLRWLEGNYVRPLISASNSEGDGRAYDFRYDRGNFTLPIWLAVKASGMRMQVDYETSIGPESVDLNVFVNVAGSGTTGQSLTIDFKQWELQRINDQLLIDLDIAGVEPTADTVQIEVDELIENLPPISGQRRQLKLQMIRALSGNEGKVSFDIPSIDRPAKRRSDVIYTPGSVRVQEKENVTIAFDPANSHGLEQLVDVATADARVYQLLSTFGKARLTHTVARRKTQVRTAIAAELAINGDQCFFSQRVAIEFSEGKLASLQLTSPRDDLQNCTGTIDGKPVFLKRDSDTTYQVRFDPLPPGSYELELTQPFPFPSQPDDDFAMLELPLSLPMELAAGGEFEMPFKVVSDSWSRDEQESSDKQPGEILVVPGIPPAIQVVRQRQRDEASLFIDRLWIQSMIGSTSRREKIVASVQGFASHLELQSPDWNEDIQVRAIVDGTELRDFVHQGNRLQIPLPQDQANAMVEVWIWDRNLAAPAIFDEITPHVTLNAPHGECYWQLVLPSGQHLVYANPEAGRAMQWQWRGLFLARKPILSTTDLERQFGSTASETLPPSNIYLFTPADLASLQATAAPRSTIWLIVGGITLILSTALVYMQWLRTPLTFLVLGFVLVGMAVTFPDLAVIFGQVSVLGLLLTVILLAIRSAIAGWPQPSVFDAPRPREGSTRSVPNPMVVGSTQSLDPRRVGPPVEANS
ncbi:hypothetical protein EC9_13390 [Rosistilla ulvae]|uniref:Uncharacterized protein n=1 Tax=Rosistilla ulvae TaxID=1930277 RepID=A0A517LX28_9BACT|nr:hypothetical protein [Rosistilla ulvae]QDS87162.1 hypothetical protein EC9_13390 [Rosistilla ulvae]